ncbi:MAG: multidrug effflux MFS transporter [Caulobacteraceae bacterium]
MQPTQSRPIDPRLVLVLGVATASGALCVDMYLPAFPVIAADLKTTQAQVQLSLVSYFVTLAIGQLFYGPVSDRIGRKGPMLFGFVLLTLGSIGCALASTPTSFILFRALQGAGAGGSVSLGRAIVRDLHTGADAAKVLSLVMLVLGVSPVLAPLLGSALLQVFSWRASFWFIAIVGVCCLMMVTFFLRETLTPDRRSARLGGALGAYGTLLRSRKFMGTALITGMSQAGFFSYLAGSAFIFISVFGLSPSMFSLVFAANAMALIGAAQFVARLIRRHGAARLVRAACVGLAVISTVLAAATAAHLAPLGVTIALVFGSIACMGLINAPSAVLAMEPYPTIAGAASALMGTLQFTCGAAAATLTSLLADGTSLPMTAVMAGCGIAALVLSQLVLRRETEA